MEKKLTKSIIGFFVYLLLFTSAAIFSLIGYVSEKFADQGIEEMLFYLTSGTEGTSSDVYISAIRGSLLSFFITFIIVCIPLITSKRRKNMGEVRMGKREFSFRIFPNTYKFKFPYALVVLFISLITSYHMLGVHDYIKSLTNYSTFIDDHYVGGNDVSITFPEVKRNLIILFLESMENSMIDKENGGGWNYTVIPELEKIAIDHLNFSNTDKIGGPYSIIGTTWTVGGMVGTTAGIPLKIPVNGNEYTSSTNFLAGAYTLGDVLEKEGYKQMLMFGSDASFGGRDNYYTSHGNYEIFDVNTAIEQRKMLVSEKVWWGFDDTLLFEWAKEEIKSLANGNEPFSMTLLTANTHFPDGYLESRADEEYDTQYENVHAYSSKQVDDFVNWLQQQNFYEDTTLVILGDHLSMQPGDFFKNHIYEGYERTIYNAIINPAAEPVDSKNRIFTSLDMYPTILGSIGVEIEGDRLGLGTNLFSDRKTLVEEFGLQYVNDELGKNSRFYNQTILQNDYYELLKKAKENEK
ncbi:LTA synthase family protein [Bacillus sp. 1P02SD]|uniref:LTA synthase family protein n=1 Tax=Bacillus sp. 1P02SD TaxID=3132264 RepID=UPI0039A0F076